MNRSRGVRLIGSLPADHGVIGPLEPIPSLIPVHGVVPAHHRGDLSHAQLLELGLELLDKVLAGGGRHVPSVQKTVDIDLFNSLLPGHLEQGKRWVMWLWTPPSDSRPIRCRAEPHSRQFSIASV